ncbi:MAG: transcriptional regulator [Halobacteria archaeon]|nr:transcriptional regulator [Halobacteria archaeon]
MTDIDKRTTRQRITKLLEERGPLTPTAISNALRGYGIELTPDEAVEQISEIKKSVDAEILVAPPECKECGFDDWHNLANIPSRCPNCRSERIREPEFKIETRNE